ncbi:NAD(P)/FAD-dependent oxidoreductase [Conexibacter sp. SYSU D00693]|uniref:phytoene desaturase family protein n=1 Tax=Conexibacter sp. SYSU D00693 TaxID=2812560 RepID=UPI00196A1FF8|nr:NAD(P)/FAD-dependent oxidoreductase [Conexibacter sp. SYSU D00693]
MADAVVIGAGPNGLVAANLLADAGWSVEVLEAQPEPGGAVRSGEVCEPGFVHDRFSSFYPFAQMPGPIPRLGLEEHGLRWRRSPHVLASVRPGDGTAALLGGALDETTALLDDPADGRPWELLMARWRRLERPFARAFFSPFPPLAGPAGIAARTRPRDLLRLARFLALEVRRMGEEHFRGRDARELLAGTALHADLAPEAVGSGAFGWIMCGLGQRHGFPVPEGGSSALTRALVARLEARGGRLRCEVPVERVVVRDGRARAVRTAHGDEVPARHAVVADVEARALYLRLVGPELLSRRVLADLERFQLDSSTVKVDWSLDGPIPWASEHARRAACLHVTDGVDELTTTMAQMATRRIPDTPFLVMGQYAVADPMRQPVGKDTAWAYTHVPQDVREDAAGELSGRWSRDELERLADRMQARVEQAAPGFGGLVRRRVVTGPEQLAEQDANLAGGALNGGTAHLHQLAMFRPIPAQAGRPETTIGRLFLASASAHPSGGVHGAPGAIAARAALVHAAPARLAKLAAQGRL